MMGTERRRILIEFIYVCGKTIVTKPNARKIGNVKPGKIRIEKPRKSRDDGTNRFRPSDRRSTRRPYWWHQAFFYENGESCLKKKCFVRWSTRWTHKWTSPRRQLFRYSTWLGGAHENLIEWPESSTSTTRALIITEKVVDLELRSVRALLNIKWIESQKQLKIYLSGKRLDYSMSDD